MDNTENKLTNVKAIFFDLYNTLACFSPTRRRYKQRHVRRSAIQSRQKVSAEGT